jgi:hypothetical protein
MLLSFLRGQARHCILAENHVGFRFKRPTRQPAEARFQPEGYVDIIVVHEFWTDGIHIRTKDANEGMMKFSLE